MASSFPATFSSTTSSLESLFPSQHRGTAASLPALLQPLPEMEEELGRPRRDHRSLTPTRPTRPPSTRTSSGDDESCTFRSESGLANPPARKPNELEAELKEEKEEGEEEGQEIEDEEQFRRHSKDDEQLFRSGRRRSI